MSSVKLREAKELVHESQASKEQRQNSGLLFCSSPLYTQLAFSSTRPKCLLFSSQDLPNWKYQFVVYGFIEEKVITGRAQINLKFYSNFITELQNTFTYRGLATYKIALCKHIYEAHFIWLSQQAHYY